MIVKVDEDTLEWLIAGAKDFLTVTQQSDFPADQRPLPGTRDSLQNAIDEAQRDIEAAQSGFIQG